MPKLAMGVEPDKIVKAVTDTVDCELEVYGQFVCEVFEGEDFQGGPALYVEICYLEGAKSVPPVVQNRLQGKLCDVLHNLGEVRFPHMDFLFGSSS